MHKDSKQHCQNTFLNLYHINRPAWRIMSRKRKCVQESLSLHLPQASKKDTTVIGIILIELLYPSRKQPLLLLRMVRMSVFSFSCPSALVFILTAIAALQRGLGGRQWMRNEVLVYTYDFNAVNTVCPFCISTALPTWAGSHMLP